ncbi:MAG TPA: hypothetical protein VFR14_00400 [Candidatus Limnocylindrales bacterium]|nr:hypothetical protein [Candidatus Limnocylindrales bacterium]
MQEEERKKTSLARASQRQGLSVDPDFERPKDQELHGPLSAGTVPRTPLATPWRIVGAPGEARRMEPTTPATIEPEIIELSGGEARIGSGRSTAWLAAWIIVLAVAVGVAALGSAGPDPADPTVVAAEDPRESASPDESSAAPSSEPQGGRSWVSLAMPVDGDAIVANVVPVAGQVTGAGPEHGWSETVAIRVEIRFVGESIGGADLSVVAGRFSGWVGVNAPVTAGSAEVVITDPRRPTRTALRRWVTLQAPDG